MNLFYFREKPPDHTWKPRFAKTEAYAALPLVKCTSCGSLWGTSAYTISRSLPSDHWLYHCARGPVSYERFIEIRNEVISMLELDDQEPVFPGTKIGPRPVKYIDSDIRSFEWPELFVTFIRSDVDELLRADGLTGWRAANVEIVGRPADSKELSVKQLIVTGRGGLPITDPKTSLISRCDVCGFPRYNLTKIRSFKIDESLWDGSDIFTFDLPFLGDPFVTERFAEALERHNFTNYDLQSIDDWIENYNRFRT